MTSWEQVMTAQLNKPPRTREDIITSMCYTWRHDFGAPVNNDFSGFGMTDEQRQSLWNQMAQIYDNDIAPFHKLMEK